MKSISHPGIERAGYYTSIEKMSRPDIRWACEYYRIPTEFAKQVLEFSEGFDFGKAGTSLDKLFSPATWDEGVKELEAAIGEDSNGAGMLACVLACDSRSKEAYRRLGLSEEMRMKTLECLPRFLEEFRTVFGTYEFCVGFWVPRHLSGWLLRIGELEYERIISEDEHERHYIISVHIPSDADIAPANVRASFLKMRELMHKKFPEFESADIMCESWLMAPELRTMLPQGSNILAFQDLFETTSGEYDAESTIEVVEYVFRRRTTEYEALPEETSLQRSLKRYLLSGSYIGEATGRIRPPAASQ